MSQLGRFYLRSGGIYPEIPCILTWSFSRLSVRSTCWSTWAELVPISMFRGTTRTMELSKPCAQRVPSTPPCVLCTSLTIVCRVSTLVFFRGTPRRKWTTLRPKRVTLIRLRSLQPVYVRTKPRKYGQKQLYVLICVVTTTSPGLYVSCVHLRGV